MFQNARSAFSNIGSLPGSVTYLLLIVTIALGLHLRMEVTKYTTVIAPLRADASDYTAYAYNLKLHGVYSRDKKTVSAPSKKPEPDALRAPGYPLFLYHLVTPGDFTKFTNNTYYLQAILGTITLIAVAYLSYLILGSYAAIVISLLCAINPHLINMGVYVLSETFFTFLLIACLTLAVKALQTNKALFWILAALFLALASLTRPTVQFFVVFLIPFIWIISPTEKKLRLSVTVALVFIGILSILLIRNMLAIGQFSDPSLTINTLHHGMYPDFTYNNNSESYAIPYRFDPESEYISSSISHTISTIWQRFIADPFHMAIWYISKPLYLFQWSMVQGYQEIFIYTVQTSPYFLDDGIFPKTLGLMKSLHIPLVWLSFIGTIIAFIPDKWAVLNKKQLLAIRLMALVYLYFILVHIVGAPFPRYSIPIRPITYILAIFSLSSAVYALRQLQNNKV